MYARVEELERRIDELTSRLARSENRLAQTEQSAAKLWGGTTILNSGAANVALWTISPSSGVTAATGVWPTLTPSTWTEDVYSDVGGTLTSVASGATIRWWYKDADPGNRLVPVIPNGDGSYDAVADSCTRVDV